MENIYRVKIYIKGFKSSRILEFLNMDLKYIGIK